MREQINIRPLERKDKQSMVKWLSTPEVLKYYEGRDKPFSEEQVELKFFKTKSRVSRWIAEVNGENIAYLQSYPLNEKERSTYGMSKEERRVVGLDQFIGETAFWNKGYGTLLITELRNRLLQDGAEIMTMDPIASNWRAIRCYEKCGFSVVKKTTKPCAA